MRGNESDVRHIEGILEIADDFDVIVLDQFGVLHDGTWAYERAAEAMRGLRTAGKRLAVLSNSGKRAAENRERLRNLGLPIDTLEIVMTSGEALWRDFADGRQSARRLHPIERGAGDAARWAAGLDIDLVPIGSAEAVLLMGLPEDGSDAAEREAVLADALARKLPVICSNPDRASPRAGGETVASPGDLAHLHTARGGTVIWYGKPHAPVFEALADALGHPSPARVLMVGDSPEHDVTGAAAMGWSTLLVRDGLHARAFASHDADAVLREIAHSPGAWPDYTIAGLAP